jgi:hypothetical protein
MFRNNHVSYHYQNIKFIVLRNCQTASVYQNRGPQNLAVEFLKGAHVLIVKVLLKVCCAVYTYTRIVNFIVQAILFQ